MLGAASGINTMDLPGKDRELSDQYLEICHRRNQRLRAARHFRDLTDLIHGLPGDNFSTAGHLTPSLALACQAQLGAELALELIYDRVRRLPFPLITRGTGWGAFSDLGLYFAFSPDYLVLPCYHTHPDHQNELGYEMPSLADYLVLEKLRDQLGGIAVCDRVFFPSGRHTVYGVDGQRQWFNRRTGQCLDYISRQNWLEVSS
jgi:hypothetical protein